ncbi:peptidylprolyl isomerase [Alkalibaculum sp. M08DMB]|uniref:peptidylprolyl isomerase n=1 Tax=Alkalibaculum sporogenes TaxID=2655001 RepID=A0A6A7K9M1_9FIRM|nr:peptidylprolyl isomerase [Alkalibaculum sporogenes]MPW26082.1 peptidylprolyl isomerase [Alkalibaculum sporogenes]
MENKVLATVNNHEITLEDLSRFLQSLDPKTSAQFQSEEGQKQVLEELINQELIFFDAKEKGLDNEDVFLREVERMKDSLLKQFALNQLLTSIPVSIDEITAFYEENKSQFVSPKSVKASHILVKEKEEAQEVLKELQEGLSFEKTAEKYSTCPSKAQGGDLGFFSRGQMVPEFEEAAFSMELNKISEPIKTQFGYHIIKVTDSKEEGTKTLLEVKEQIKQQIIGQKQQLIYFDKIAELKKIYKVEISA